MTSLAASDVSPAVGSQRLYYLDNMRAIAMFLGIVLHACMPYSKNMALLFADANHWLGFDISFWFIHMFRMGVFFVIAGYFARLLQQKYGSLGLLRHRSRRVLLPFAVFLIATAPFLLAVMLWANQVVEYPGFVLGLLNQQSGETQSLSTGHLWFLYYLYLFCLCAAALGSHEASTLTKVFSGPWCFLLLPLLMWPSISWQGSSINAPDGLVPQLWAFGFYGLYFLLGWVSHQQPQFFGLCERYKWLLLAAGCLLFGVKWLYTPEFSIAGDQVNSALPYASKIDQNALVISLTCFCSVYLVLGFIGLGKSLLNWQTPALSYLTRASYWVYLMHMVVLLAVQVVLSMLVLPVGLKFVLSVSITLAICLYSYKLLVEHTWLGRMLNG